MSTLRLLFIIIGPGIHCNQTDRPPVYLAEGYDARPRCLVAALSLRCGDNRLSRKKEKKVR